MPGGRGGNSGSGDNLVKRKGIWYARREVRGRDIRRSLRTASRAEAKKRLPAVLKQLDHLAFYGEYRHTWKAAVVEWAASAPEISPGTLKRYLVSINQLGGILDNLYIDEISTRTVAQIARRAGVSNATRRRDITAVSVILRWCVSQDWREDNPAKAWDRSVIKERRDPIVLPTLYDIDCAVAAAPGNFARLIRIAQYTGMREEECASLERPEIDLRRRAIQLSKTKTNRPRSISLDDRALGTLSGTPAHLDTAFVFWHAPGDRYRNVASRFSTISLVAQARAKAEDRPIPRRIRFHDLRHWYAVDKLRSGGSIYTLQKLLGHASIKTTEIYLDFLTPEEQEQAKAGSAQNPAQV
jgi:integrase